MLEKVPAYIFFSATTRVTIIDKEEWEKRKKSIKAKLFLKRENLLTKVIIWLLISIRECILLHLSAESTRIQVWSEIPDSFHCQLRKKKMHRCSFFLSSFFKRNRKQNINFLTQNNLLLKGEWVNFHRWQLCHLIFAPQRFLLGIKSLREEFAPVGAFYF